MKAEKTWIENRSSITHTLTLDFGCATLFYRLRHDDFWRLYGPGFQYGTLLLALDVDAAKTEAERFVAGYLKSTIAAYSAMVDTLEGG